MANTFKKTEVKLELLNDIYMLLMVEKGIRGGMQLINLKKLIINIGKIIYFLYFPLISNTIDKSL